MFVKMDYLWIIVKTKIMKMKSRCEQKKITDINPSFSIKLTDLILKRKDHPHRSTR